MSEFDKDFCQRMYSVDINTYISRLKAIGFWNLHRVLDAGCGFGQWTMALARLNGIVVAVDKDAGRVEWLREKVKETPNVVVKTSRLEEFSPKERFDGIFCYGTLYYTPWKEMLRKFHRWLRRGGKLYVTFNEIGWYVHLWLNAPHAVTGYDPRMVAAKAFRNTLNYQREGRTNADIIICTDEIRRFLLDLGMDVWIGDEGTIGGDCPFFEGKYYGLPGVREVLAVK